MPTEYYSLAHLLSKYIYALPLHRNHQHKKPTRPPTITITATAMPAMAPVERPLLLTLPPLSVPSVLT
eukprot:XP_001708479.1 Hypothetical protein GL50803_31936 [Giardia lamblia ATCC 50803]